MRYKSKLDANGEERDFGHNATVIEDTSAADKFVKETKELSNADFKAAQNFQDKQISSVQDVYKKKMSMDFTYSGKIDASIRDNINGDPNSPSKTSIIGSPSFSKHRSEDILTKFEYLININTQTRLSDYNDSAIESPRGLQDAQLKMPCLRALMQEFPPKVPPYDLLTLLQSPATEQVSSSQALPTLPPSRSGTFIKPPSLIRLQPASNPGNMKMMRKNESLLNASIFDQGFDPEESFLARANLRPFDDDKGNVGASPKNNKAILKDFTPNTPQKSVLNSMRRTSWVDPNILN
jgi:hypothetical protein